MLRCQQDGCRKEAIYICSCDYKVTLCPMHCKMHRTSQGKFKDNHDDIIIEDEIIRLRDVCISKIKNLDEIEKIAFQEAMNMVKLTITQLSSLRKRIEQEQSLRINAIRDQDLSALEKFREMNIIEKEIKNLKNALSEYLNLNATEEGSHEKGDIENFHQFNSKEYKNSQENDEVNPIENESKTTMEICCSKLNGFDEIKRVLFFNSKIIIELIIRKTMFLSKSIKQIRLDISIEVQNQNLFLLRQIEIAEKLLKIDKNKIKKLSQKLSKKLLKYLDFELMTTNEVIKKIEEENKKRNEETKKQNEESEKRRNAQSKNLKVVLIGDSGVGKSKILVRYITDKFDDRFESTLGASFMSKDVKFNDNLIHINI